ncbi:flippase [Clostridium baratii]|uniref:flippase n=1 Tax=Clostridium baratii TaxID=1561 RepID=UPI0006BACBDF|nr:flippase [Clostridium baratii]
MVIKNYLYNLMYQLMVILLPIITIPYISRVLGVDGIGEYALTSTYAQYFVFLGMMGLSIYSSREIAYVRDSSQKLNEVFWELNFLRFITVGISFVIYLSIFIILVNNNSKLIYMIQSLVIISAFFDISWLFIGIENFKKIAIRNMIVKIIGVLFIFLLIKDNSQVWLYALIIGGTQLIGQIVMWFDLPSEIKFKKPKKINMIKHLKNSIKLFIPQIAISVYSMLDKIMLGGMTNEAEVGLYDNSQRIIKILIVVVTTLATVTLPKMASLYKKNEMKKFEENVYKSFSFVSFIALPMALGLAAITNSFVPWFFGAGFDGIKPLFYIGALLMITLAWSSILGNQILISIKREKQFTISVVSGAILNVIINLILISKYYSIGTMISSVLAEYCGMFLMLYFSRDILEIKKLFKFVPRYTISSFIMFFIIYPIGIFLNESIVTTAIQILLGIFIYIIIMILLKDENLQQGLNFIKSIIKK